LVQQDLPAHLGLQDQWELQVQTELVVRRAGQDLQDLRERQALQEEKGQLGHQARLGSLDLQVLPDHSDSLERPELPERLEALDLLVCLDLTVLPDYQALQDPMAILVLTEIQGTQGTREPRDCQELKEPPGVPGRRDRKDHLGRQDPKDQRDLLEPKETQDLSVLRDHNLGLRETQDKADFKALLV